jgi:hypothetical protein
MFDEVLHEYYLEFPAPGEVHFIYFGLFINAGFILYALYCIIQELSSQEDFFMELVSILKPGGQVLIVEPPFHVSKADFVKIIKKAEDVGFKSDEGPRVILNKTVILKKG